MCGITIRWPTRSPKFWPGYRHSNPRDDTATFDPVGLKRLETGCYKLKNIGIGLMVLVGVNLMAQSYFAMEVPGLARPTLGKGEHTGGEKDIANKLRF